MAFMPENAPAVILVFLFTLAVPLQLDGSAFGLEWTPDGKSLVLGLAPTPLVDDRYMARKLHHGRKQTPSVQSVDMNRALAEFK